MNITSLDALKKSDAYAGLLALTQDSEPLDLEHDSDFIYEEIRIAYVELFLHEMKKKGMTQTDLAQKLGKTKQFVSRVLANTGNITLQTIAAFCAAIGIPSDKILPRIPEPVYFESGSSYKGFKFIGSIKKEEVDILAS